MPANSDPVPPMTPDPTARRIVTVTDNQDNTYVLDASGRGWVAVTASGAVIRVTIGDAAEAKLAQVEAERDDLKAPAIQRVIQRAEAAEAKLAQVEQALEDARVRAYRAARIWEPNMDAYNVAMAVYDAAFPAVLAASPGTTPEDPA